MSKAKNGDKVKVHYTGKLKDGTIFDSSVDREPIAFTLGEGRVIPGFEQAVLGMALNESKIITIPAEDAYGPHREEMVQELNWDMFPEGFEVEVGDNLQLKQNDGRTMDVTVTEVTDEIVTIDANHPLAGKDLVFDIMLVEIS